MEHVSRQRNIPFGTVHKKMFKKNTQAQGQENIVKSKNKKLDNLNLTRMEEQNLGVGCIHIADSPFEFKQKHVEKVEKKTVMWPHKKLKNMDEINKKMDKAKFFNKINCNKDVDGEEKAKELKNEKSAFLNLPSSEIRTTRRIILPQTNKLNNIGTQLKSRNYNVASERVVSMNKLSILVNVNNNDQKNESIQRKVFTLNNIENQLHETKKQVSSETFIKTKKIDNFKAQEGQEVYMETDEFKKLRFTFGEGRKKRLFSFN